MYDESHLNMMDNLLCHVFNWIVIGRSKKQLELFHCLISEAFLVRLADCLVDSFRMFVA